MVDNRRFKWMIVLGLFLLWAILATGSVMTTGAVSICFFIAMAGVAAMGGSLFGFWVVNRR